MNVQEQHIEVNLSSQKIASNVNRKFDPSEIDWILNKMVDRFMKDRIREDQDSLGFDATEIDLDALRTLVEIDTYVPLFRKDPAEFELYGDLPGDYSYLIDDASMVVQSCNNNFVQASKTQNKTKYIYKFELKETIEAATPYNVYSFTLAGINILNSAGTGGTRSKKELFTFKDFLLGQLWQLDLPGVEFYWERYNGNYDRGNIIVVCDSVKAGDNSITIDGTNTPATASTIVRSYIPTTTVNARLKANRLIKGQVRSNVLDSTFAGSKPDSPITAISKNQLKVYCNERFIVSRLKISYIRKPKKISLSLAQDCDLAEEFHMQICDMAVLYIKELTMSPDWEIKLRDNMSSKN